jgi:hypothetical protein
MGARDTTGYGPDEWDDDVLMHEYGHHIGFWGGFGTDVDSTDDHQPHYLDAANANMNTSWQEGWATFFDASARPTVDGFTTNVGIRPSGLYTRRDFFVEGDSIVFYAPVPTPNWSSATRLAVNVNERGPLWEGAVAGALYDIYDTRDDNQDGDAYADSLSDSFDSVYDAMRKGSPPGTDNIVDILTARQWYDSLKAHPRTDIVKFGRSQRVFWEHGITGGPTLTAVQESPPAAGASVRAFPNPFNPRVRISFVLPGSGPRVPLSLRIYDVRGRLVRDLASGFLVPGRYERIWDGITVSGEAAASGVYVCRLVSGRSEREAKLTLLR